jgi:hypothetical protein
MTGGIVPAGTRQAVLVQWSVFWGEHEIKYHIVSEGEKRSYLIAGPLTAKDIQPRDMVIVESTGRKAWPYAPHTLWRLVD